VIGPPTSVHQATGGSRGRRGRPCARVVSRGSSGTPAALLRGVPRRLATRLATLVLLFAAACTGTIDRDAVGDGGPGDSAPGRTVDITGPAVLPHVQRFADAVCGATDACTISTYEGHQPVAARAIDILVSDAYGSVPSDDNALGDRVAAWGLAHQAEFGVSYVIFRQRINDGTGWKPMEDRGSITQNHYDHVHVSFEETAP